MSIADQDGSRAGATTGAAGGRGGRSGAFGWLLCREVAVNALLVAVMVAVVWGSIFLHLRQQRGQTTARARQESSNVAQAAAESIGQTIASVDDALRFMRAIYLEDPKGFDIAAWTNRANQAREEALEFALIDRDGKLLVSSLPSAATAGDFSRQDFFLAATGDAPDRLYIGQPVRGRTANRWSLPFTRRIVAADGWGLGVISAAVDPAWLMRMQDTFEAGSGSLMLVGADGAIRALALGSAPGSMHGIGARIDLPGLLGTSPDRGTRDWTNPVDGTAQLVSYWRLPDDGAIVIFGLDEANVMAPYREYARQYEMFGAGLTVLILLTGCLLLNNTRRLLQSSRLLHDCMDAIGQGIVMVDRNGRMPFINRRAGEMLRIANYTQGESGLAAPAETLLLPAPSREADPTFEQPCADGTVLEISTHALADGVVVRTYADITERKRAEALILHLARHDSLTGLPNRRLLIDRVTEEIVRARGGGAGGAVLLIDVDGLKIINGARGHVFGNRVLRIVADRLRGFARDGDLVARIAGDEFCLLLPGQDEPSRLARRAGELVRLISEPVQIEDREVLPSVSIGIACYPHDGSTVEAVLAKADMALLRAKEGGRATFRLYEPEMDARAAERRQLEQDLRNAVMLEQFSIVYQPIFAAATGNVVAFEALLRWFHPTRGAIAPGDFVPVAEECGLAVELGLWVMRKACVEAASWLPPMPVACNLSARQFCGPGIADRVASILAETGLAAERLVLEITEDVFIDCRERALAAMSALTAQGIRIALDAFGSGFSSLSYLHQLAFDSIKIDRALIAPLPDDEEAQAIVRASLTLGRCLHMKMVADGVQTQAQLDWLRAEGCDEVQGPFLASPEPAQQIAARLSGMRHDLVAAPMPDSSD